jgi:hypothetical protein
VPSELAGQLEGGKKLSARALAQVEDKDPESGHWQRLLRQYWRCKFDAWMRRIALNQQ